MFKPLVLSLAVAGLSAAAITPVSADYDDRWDRGTGFDVSQRQLRQQRFDRRWNRWERRAYRDWRRNYRRDLRRDWRRYQRQRQFWNGRWHYRPWAPHPAYRYRHSGWGWNGNWGPAFIGGVTLGTAISGSAQDRRDSDFCGSCDHWIDGTSRSEIESCFRVEQLPDGSEQRVELPLSACF